MTQKKTFLVHSAFIIAAFCLIALTTLASATPVTSEKISLSIGNVLGSVNLDVTAMVLSKDKKIAFTTVNYYGTLKILDISNENYPSIISSLALKQTGPVFKIKSLLLSSDEKTLYVSNSRDVEIIDVSNLEAPVLLSFTKSTIFDDISFLQSAGSFRTSLAVDETTQTLFIGGLGLQVYDILNPQRPALLSASKNGLDSDGKVERNEISLVQEKKMLLEANRDLKGYDVSNPRDLKLLYSFQAPSVAHSLFMSDDSKTVYLLGNAADIQKLTEVDISDPKNPKLVNDYDLEVGSTVSTGFLTVSPNKTKFYISYDNSGKNGLLIFDTIEKVTTQIGREPFFLSLIDNVYAMVFVHDGKTLITASNDQFAIIELPKDYPNSQVLETVFPINVFELSSSYQGMQVTSDGSVFVLRSVTQAVSPRLYSILEIYKGRNPMGSYEGDQSFIQMVVTKDYKTVYLLGRQTLYAIDVTDRNNLVRTKIYTMKNSNIVFSRFLLSEDGKTGFLATREGDNSGDAKITLFQFTDSSYIEPLSTIDKIFAVSNVNMVRYRTDGLIVIDKEINIYNISNINAPVLASSFPIGDHEISPFISSVLLSRDNNTLYLDTYDDNQFTSLRIYDLTNLKSPSLLSDFALPKFDSQSLRPPFFLTPDQQSGYVFQDNSLLKLNLSNLNYPVVIGSITLSSNKTEKINNVVVAENGQFGQLVVSVTDKEVVRVFRLALSLNFYLKQEKFLLGQKYSNAVSLIVRTRSLVDYDCVNQSEYKIIKLSFVDIKIVPNLFTLKSTTAPLPSWITFDKQTNSLTVEPKNQAALGSYALRATISMRFPTDAFRGFSDPSEDIMACLISLGYIDPQFFLTSHFGSYDDFLLPSRYASDKIEIYNILRHGYVEASTGFSVVPSLTLSHTDSLAISTLSTNGIVLDIKLYPYSGDSQVRFLSKQYDLVLAALSEAKSRIILEGSLVAVNSALKSIIVDFTGNSTSTYDAFISVSDGLNPAYSTYVASANKYFLQNQAPIQNPSKSSLQEQVEKISIATGQYFNIQFDPQTFIDSNGNDLTYHFEMSDQTAEIPSWIVFEKLTLHGTAPEDLTGRTLKMVLVVKNEFREVRTSFTLNVKLTATTMIKLIAKVAFILMIIVLAISTLRSCGSKKGDEERLPRDSKEYLLRRTANNEGF